MEDSCSHRAVTRISCNSSKDKDNNSSTPLQPLAPFPFAAHCPPAPAICGARPPEPDPARAASAARKRGIIRAALVAVGKA